MLSNPPHDDMRQRYNHVSITWPTEILYQNDKFAGYLMPRLPESHKVLDIYNPRTRRAKCPGFNWKYLVHTCLNLSIAMDAVHQRNYVIGDINEGNILVNSRALVSLIDTDSFQVRDSSGQVFRCPVGKEEFTPPELQGIQFNQVDRLRQHDYFGLAVLIFLLLMEGNHPFSGKMKIANPSSDPDNIYCLKHGLFPYASNSMCGPRPVAPRFEILPLDIRRMMLRGFVEGYNHPEVRPSPAEWSQALEKMESSLRQCRKNDFHWYSTHLRNCPWCLREKPRLQVPLPPTSQPPSGKPKTFHKPAVSVATAASKSQSTSVLTRRKLRIPGISLSSVARQFPKFQPSTRIKSTHSQLLSSSRTSRDKFRKNILGLFPNHSSNLRITRQLWWRSIKVETLLGLAVGIGLAVLLVFTFNQPSEAGMVISAIPGLCIVLIGIWFAFLRSPSRINLRLSTPLLIKTGTIFGLGFLAYLAWNVSHTPITSFLSQYSPQAGWLTLDGVLLGSSFGAALGTFKFLSYRRNLVVALLGSACLIALPLFILFSVGAFSYSLVG